MALTELQRRKLTRFFHIYDLDGDGVIQREDYVLLARNIAASKGFSDDTPLAKRLEEVMLRVWENLEILADKDHDHIVTLDEFLDYRDKLHQDDDKYDDLVRAGLTIFDLLDMNNDGKIDVSEFKIFYGYFNLSGELAVDMFNKLDMNSTGYLSRQEVTDLGRQFDMSNDPNAPGNWLFGPY